jgi:hypothetical protein
VVLGAGGSSPLAHPLKQQIEGPARHGGRAFGNQVPGGQAGRAAPGPLGPARTAAASKPPVPAWLTGRR